MARVTRNPIQRWKAQRSRSTDRLSPWWNISHIFGTWRPRLYERQTWYADGVLWPASPTYAVTSKVQGQGHQSDRCCDRKLTVSWEREGLRTSNPVYGWKTKTRIVWVAAESASIRNFNQPAWLWSKHGISCSYMREGELFSPNLNFMLPASLDLYNDREEGPCFQVRTWTIPTHGKDLTDNQSTWR